jgi:hypothetical protein
LGFVPDGGTRADVPDAAGHIEMYDSGRYLTVTGARIEDSPADVRQVNDEIGDVHAEHITDDEPAGSVDRTAQESRNSQTDLGRDELLERARNADNSEKFRRLWNGETSGYPSPSEADLALCGMLAFWTGGDRQRIADLFRQSGLCREKWERDDYRERTIGKALEGRTEFYDPDSARSDVYSQDAVGDYERNDGGGMTALFIKGCGKCGIDSGRVATIVHNGEKRTVSVGSVIPDDADIGEAVLAFQREADQLDGVDKQAVIGYAVLFDLRDRGEFFETPSDRLYYFHEPETCVYRVDSGGRREFTKGFQAFLTERYELFAGRFSRNLATDIHRRARRDAPERPVYQFAHFDEAAGELYVTDFGSGYYAVTPDGIEWRSNGTDVFFVPDNRADPIEYIPPGERGDLPNDLPGERPLWRGDGDPLMRVFGNRVNYDEGAALGPADQRNQLYVHLHTLPFIDVLDARPIMTWVGEKGSGKTVLQRSIGQFIYGEQFAGSVMPDAKDDFLAKVSNQALAFLDNYDDGVGWANDILAAVATGAGIDQRELYTTNALHREVPRCWLSLTSRDPPHRRDDVADRTLVFRVERVEDGFVAMGDYLQQVTAHRPLLWSTYLDNLQAIVAEYRDRDTNTMSADHRMADWAIFAHIVGDALNITDIEALLNTIQTERATFALENEPWAQVLGDWVNSNPETAATWLSAAELADKVESYAAENKVTFIKSHPSALGSKLSEYHNELAELYGLEIKDRRRSNSYRFDTDTGNHSRG